MALSQRLQIRQSQALVMTPQLMQAIKLLQLSNLDLVAYVEAELERNPLLDRGAEAEPAASPAEAASCDRPSGRRRTARPGTAATARTDRPRATETGRHRLDDTLARR